MKLSSPRKRGSVTGSPLPRGKHDNVNILRALRVLRGKNTSKRYQHMSNLIDLITQSIACKCPKCGKGELFKPGFLNLNLNDTCSSCGLDLAKNDSADGPAVFLIFILGFLIVPLALLFDSLYEIPVWVHLFIWAPICLAIIFGLLKPIKALVLTLQWKHRASDWSK